MGRDKGEKMLELVRDSSLTRDSLADHGRRILAGFFGKFLKGEKKWKWMLVFRKVFKGIPLLS